MVEASAHVKIPIERVGVLIGPEGYVRGFIERRLGVELQIDSESGDVGVRLRPETPDPTSVFRARDIVKAIGRGFSPERAFRLLDEDVSFGVIDLREYFERSQADIRRVKGRIIGKNGKTRRLIEELSGAHISVYGHTIAIIGRPSQFEAARDAVEMLIKGREHRSVYRFLHWKRRELKKEAMELWESPPPEARRERNRREA
ncbi:MAG: pre-rRNA-processing protein PNO1 [Candidatus Bathyarchaeia archaeon]